MVRVSGNLAVARAMAPQQTPAGQRAIQLSVGKQTATHRAEGANRLPPFPCRTLLRTEPDPNGEPAGDTCAPYDHEKGEATAICFDDTRAVLGPWSALWASARGKLWAELVDGDVALGDTFALGAFGKGDHREFL